MEKEKEMKEKKTERLCYNLSGKKISKRVFPSVRKNFENINLKTGLSFTEIVHLNIINFNDNNISIDKKSMIIEKDFKNEFNFSKAKRKLKEYNFKTYLVRNVTKVIYEQQQFFYFTAGKLNMKIANKQIDLAWDIFKTLNADIQKDYKENMDFLEKCRNENFLEEQMMLLKIIYAKPKKRKRIELDENGKKANTN